MMKKGLIIVSILFSTCAVNAQLWLIAANCIEVCAIFEGVAVETKMSSVGAQPLLLIGAKGLIGMGEKVSLGFGYHAGFSTSSNGSNEIPENLAMESISLTGEYHSRVEETVHFSFPVTIGYAQAWHDYSYSVAHFGYAEPGINVVYRPFKSSFTIGAGVSYRQTLGADQYLLNDVTLSRPSAQFFFAYGL